VDPEHEVVEHALDEVEEPPADEARAGERAPGPGLGRARRRAPEQHDAGQRHRPREGMEQPVPHHVELEVHDARRRIERRQHVVELEDLVEDDAVDEAAEPDAEHRAGGDQRAAVSVRRDEPRHRLLHP
jgi:hypothetical protein